MAAYLDELCLALGVILMVCALRMITVTRKWLKRCVNTKGQIVGFTESRDSDSGATHYFDAIRFTDQNGDSHEIGGPHARQHPPKIGRSVPITYDPAQPTNAFVTGSASPWVIPVLVTVLSVVAAGVGVALRLQ